MRLLKEFVNYIKQSLFKEAFEMNLKAEMLRAPNLTAEAGMEPFIVSCTKMLKSGSLTAFYSRQSL